MSLFNIEKVPEKETTVLQCKICKGVMEEQSETYVSKFFKLFMQKNKNTKRYRCVDCEKELFIRER